MAITTTIKNINAKIKVLKPVSKKIDINVVWF
jgi:hypothetical protein